MLKNKKHWFIKILFVLFAGMIVFIPLFLSEHQTIGEEENFIVEQSNDQEETTELEQSEEYINVGGEAKDKEQDENEEPLRNETAEEGATIITGTEDANEDYASKAGLSGEGLKQYTQKIFLDLCRDPKKIDLYDAVFTADSISCFKEMEWYYDNPKVFYDWAESSVYDENSDYIGGSVAVDSQYGVWELELKEGEEGKMGYMAFFTYEISTGLIEIREHFLAITYF